MEAMRFNMKRAYGFWKRKMRAASDAGGARPEKICGEDEKVDRLCRRSLSASLD